MKKFIGEFKEFISKGNVIDMAVGLVIGSAFTAIVTSVVDNILMPLISLITGGIDFTQWNVTLSAATEEKEAVVLGIGILISAIIKFIIVALVVFAVVKAVNKLRAKKDAEKEAAPATTKECPYCLGVIPIKATKCQFCASDVPVEEEEAS